RPSVTVSCNRFPASPFPDVSGEPNRPVQASKSPTTSVAGLPQPPKKRENAGLHNWPIRCIEAPDLRGSSGERERSRNHMNGQNAAREQGRQAEDPSRYDELKGILEERRREIMSEVQGRMRDVRAEGAGSAVQGVLDAAESSELDIQDEIEFALIQMKAETLNKIDEALRRLEEGTYGYCLECGEEISEKRLGAVPFTT